MTTRIIVTFTVPEFRGIKDVFLPVAEAASPDWLGKAVDEFHHRVWQAVSGGVESVEVRSDA